MRYIAAAIRLGYPPDCASKGDSYADLLRTWNAAYGSPPPLPALLEPEAAKGAGTLPVAFTDPERLRQRGLMGRLSDFLRGLHEQ